MSLLITLILSTWLNLALSENANSEENFQNAYRYILNGKPLEGVNKLRKLALSGNLRANEMLAQIFWEGDIVDYDSDQACKYAEAASNLGSLNGKFRYADCLHAESDSDIPTEKVIKLYQEAIDGGFSELPAFDLQHLEDFIDLPSQREIEEISISYVRSDDPNLIFYGGLYLFYNSQKSSIKEREGADAIRRAASMGLPSALYHEAYLYFDETYDYAYSPEAYINSIKHGVLSNLVYLPYLDGLVPDSVNSGRLSAKDVDVLKTAINKAESWEADYIYSALGDLFSAGSTALDIEIDHNEAIKYYEKCVLQIASFEQSEFMSDCLNNHGVKYADGLGVDMDEMKANEYYERSVQIGNNPFARFNLGMAYMHGYGVDINYEQAMIWLEEAAELGNTDSLYYIGELYEVGLGTNIDYEKAEEYYRRSISESDDVVASYVRLAYLIETGLVSGELEESVDLYQSALKLEPEEHNLKVLSQAKARLPLLESKITQRASQSDNIEYGNYFALLIGIDEYSFLQDLKTPVNDIRRLGSVLESDFGFDVRLLENATRADILKSLSSLRRELDEQDNLLIYYAGHGFLDSDTDLGFWQPSDSEAEDDLAWIPTDRITKTLKGMKSNNIAVISDSCFAGTILRSGAVATETLDDSVLIQKLVEKKTRVAFASGGLEPVPDNLSGGENSIFALNLISALKDSKRVTPAANLFLTIQQNVIKTSAKLGFDQSPEFSALYDSGHEGGDFIFVKK